MCLTSEDHLFSFGAGTYGECGYGESKDTLVPRLVKLPEKLNSLKNQIDDEDENQFVNEQI